MIDLVSYINKEEHDIIEHTDPGLLSLSFYQDQEGL
jgi:hypothetical protein